MTSKAENKIAAGKSENVELKGDQSIETPTHEFNREVEAAAFMEEVVVVLVHETTDENQPPNIVMSVNNIHQPIFRGVQTPMRRKFLEVLARCKESKFSQHTVNPNEPDRIELRERTVHAYPFSVLHDPNPKGAAWLQAVIAERN